MVNSKNSVINSKKLPSKEEAIKIMKNLGLARNIIRHEQAVMRKAKDIAYNITKNNVNIELVVIGALMHDIGRARIHGMMHGPVGGDLIREMGFPEELAKITETHIMAGLDPDEAKMFNMPQRNYIPKTIEEKIVCLADKYLSGKRKVTIEQRFQRWFDKFGQNSFLKKQIKQAKELEEEILRKIY